MTTMRNSPAIPTADGAAPRLLHGKHLKYHGHKVLPWMYFILQSILQLYQGFSQRKWKAKGAGGQQGLVSLQQRFWDAHRAAPNGRTTARSALTARQDFCLASAASQPSYPWVFPPRRSIWKRFTTEPAPHRRQAAAPAPSRAVS